jgi:hypothetical protein
LQEPNPVSKKRYEYTFAEGDKPTDMTPAMEQFGRAGWELVNVVFDSKETKYVAFLKKKIRLGKAHHEEEGDD